MQSFDAQVLKYILPSRILECLENLHPKMVVTQGRHESLVPGYIIDLEWNFYDELHRYHVHNTYDDMYKIMAGKYFSVNIVRWKNLPIFIQVANAKISEGLFYQCMTIFGVICVHQVQKITQKNEQVLIEIDWYTASHKLFRWIHPLFNKRLLKLHRQQDEEDNREIRGRRFDLRCRGLTFLTDDPNFINSNMLTDNVRLPYQKDILRIELKKYLDGNIHRIDCGSIEFMLRKHKINEIELWPAICPHEGALLEPHHLCNNVVVCPWHGRRFSSVVLDLKDRTQWSFLKTTITYYGSYIDVASDQPEKVICENIHEKHVVY